MKCEVGIGSQNFFGDVRNKPEDDEEEEIFIRRLTSEEDSRIKENFIIAIVGRKSFQTETVSANREAMNSRRSLKGKTFQ